jgi:hypothetical protein
VHAGVNHSRDISLILSNEQTGKPAHGLGIPNRDPLVAMCLVGAAPKESVIAAMFTTRFIPWSKKVRSRVRNRREHGLASAEPERSEWG